MLAALHVKCLVGSRLVQKRLLIVRSSRICTFLIAYSEGFHHLRKYGCSKIPLLPFLANCLIYLSPRFWFPSFVIGFQERTMERLKDIHRRRLVLQPTAGSFSAEGQASRWSNPDLDPVPMHQKKWEWYHVGGFWIAEGFSAAQIQTASASVALGLNPGIALIAYFIGNILVVMACCGTGYIGSKVPITYYVFLFYELLLQSIHTCQQ